MSATFRLETTPGIAAGLVLLWVQIYTAGLSGEIRERRVGQIYSDLWEHYSDRNEQGASPAVIGLEAIGRAARGAAADLFWRFQLEGPQVQINIPIERLGGACLLLLVAAAMLSLNVAAYDPNAEGFDGELRRLASIDGWQTGMYTASQVLSGIGMLAGAVVLYLMLRRHSTTPIILAAVALASAGLLALVNSALYATAAGLADEYVAAAPEHRDAVLTVGRAFVLMLTTVVWVMAVMLALGVYGFAVITARHHLVPSWLSFVAGGSVVAMGAAMVTDLIADSDITWLSYILFLGLLLLWLIVAGAWLLLGGFKMAPDDQQPSATEDLVAPGLAHEPHREQPLKSNRWLVGTMVVFLCASLVAVGIVGIPGLLILTVPVGVLLITIAYSMARRIRLPEGQP